jgi:hypothetical protein
MRFAQRKPHFFYPDYALESRNERQKTKEINTFVSKPYSSIWCMNKRG